MPIIRLSYPSLAEWAERQAVLRTHKRTLAGQCSMYSSEADSLPFGTDRNGIRPFQRLQCNSDFGLSGMSAADGLACTKSFGSCYKALPQSGIRRLHRRRTRSWLTTWRCSRTPRSFHRTVKLCRIQRAGEHFPDSKTDRTISRDVQSPVMKSWLTLPRSAGQPAAGSYRTDLGQVQESISITT